MKRPILIITLGFLIGIILGLYVNIAPFLLTILTGITLVIKIIDIKARNRYIKILKVFIKNNIILTFFISALISSIYLKVINNRYQEVYDTFNKNKIIGTVVSNKTEGEYKNSYKIRLEKDRNVNFILKVSKDIDISYGNKVMVEGEYSVAEIDRNYGGFNYQEYLKTEGIYGIFKADRVEILKNNNLSMIEIFTNNVKEKIIANTSKILPEHTKELFLGILIGYDDNISEEIEESFRKSSLTHLLAVSGSHIVYIITGLGFCFSKIKFNKKINNILTMIFLILFMYIVEFSASVVRASIMGIIVLISLIIYRKNDVTTSISISILLILVKNPYKILNIGLLLSYFATIGIICCSKLKAKKEKSNKLLIKIFDYLKELIFITLFANIFVMPISLYNFNTISLTFVISNLISGILIGPITIGGFVLVIISVINLRLAYIIAILYNILLELLIYTTNLTSVGPLCEIFITTPNVIFVIFYYLILFIVLIYLNLIRQDNKRFLVKKFFIYINNFKKSIKKNYRFIIILIVLITIIFSILNIIPKDFKIYFIDVGQGDSTLIITPTNKKILIDSGGAEMGAFDVGKSTLFPYLLDIGITTLDYICISHFDSDHCDGFKYLLENMKINNVILSKQYEKTTNFEEIIKIIKQKKVKILQAEEGDKFEIDNFVRIDILSPGTKLTDDINDNSIVMKLEFLKFSCLFTGDISESIEEELIKKYGENLKSDILKVAHHRF